MMTRSSTTSSDSSSSRGSSENGASFDLMSAYNDYQFFRAFAPESSKAFALTLSRPCFKEMSPKVTDQISLQISELLENGELLRLIVDRNGVKFLEENYPRDPSDEIHRKIFEKLTESDEVFSTLCHDPNGNFMAQKLIEYATCDEQTVLVKIMIGAGLESMCRSKYACRVVQMASEKFDLLCVFQLIDVIKSLNLASLCTDQCALHVFHRFIKHLPIDLWTFFVEFLCSDDNLMLVSKNKFGCRLVQQIIDKLAENHQTHLQLLHYLMACVSRNCYRLSSNEFANYVMQHILKTSGMVLEMYRDTIIEKCLLRNLLSMSQDKYASHVIEQAFLHAPPTLLSEMMKEIFEGYVKDQENRDALDVLLFHQYGNYIVQKMIFVCTVALTKNTKAKLPSLEVECYAHWFEAIKARVLKCSARLERFSSGKKIIEQVKIELDTSFKLDSLMDLNASLDAQFLSSSFLLSNNFFTY